MVPLSNHVLFQSSDLDYARERVAQKFCDHRLDIIGDRSAFRVTHNYVPGEMISLNYISYGADVLIDPGELGDFYLIQMPIAGTATIRNGTREFLTNRNVASVLNADLATRMKWWQGCAQLHIQVRKAPLHALAMRLLDRDIPGPLIFDPLIDFSRPEMQAWRRLANSLFHAADMKAPSPAAGIRQAMHEQHLLELFLRSQPNNMSLFFDDRRQGAAPRHLKRAEEFIRANVASSIGLLEIAEAAGVAPRTLQLAYRNAFGFSPMRALTRERMRRARFDLVASDATVTDVALKWGFTHFGRFAAEYRHEFGELPRETRRTRHDFGHARPEMG
ncbi:AraC family transcriptional regulator [Mesorhizobium sp. CC13]|uniref:AraC family transcriptional regulator n=1 Tax=Mesorhizobium sp. CC13 TaxID=3029194 RepID=UPI0032656814